jgi:hypothetical protein
MITLADVLKAFTITTRVAIAIVIATAIVLFTAVPHWLGVSLDGYRLAVVGLFILSLAVLAAAAITKLWDSWAAKREWDRDTRRRRRQWRREHDKYVAILQGMMNPERAVCRGFILGEQRTVFLRPDGTVSTLVTQGVLRQLGELTVNELGEVGANFMMEDWAWDHLRANTELVAVRPFRE